MEYLLLIQNLGMNIKQQVNNAINKNDNFYQNYKTNNNIE